MMDLFDILITRKQVLKKAYSFDEMFSFPNNWKHYANCCKRTNILKCYEKPDPVFKIVQLK